MDKLKLYIVNNRITLILISIIVVLAAVLISCYFFYEKEECLACPICNNDILISNEDKEIIEYFYVDIKGYVNKPGVYSFEKDSDYRIKDLISKAGGLKKGADTSIINLSTKLKDEMVIIIYSEKQIIDYVNTKKEESEKLNICYDNKNETSGCIKDNNEETKDNTLININTSTKEELQALTGIGESKAILIINYRQEHGLFNKIEDIMNVSGIGESVFATIKNNITV